MDTKKRAYDMLADANDAIDRADELPAAALLAEGAATASPVANGSNGARRAAGSDADDDDGDAADQRANRKRRRKMPNDLTAGRSATSAWKAPPDTLANARTGKRAGAPPGPLLPAPAPEATAILKVAECPELGVVIVQRIHVPCFKIDVDVDALLLPDRPDGGRHATLWVVADVQMTDGQMLDHTEGHGAHLADVINQQAKVVDGRASFPQFRINVSSHGHAFYIYFKLYACESPEGPIDVDRTREATLIHTLRPYTITVVTSTNHQLDEYAKRVWDADEDTIPRATNTKTIGELAKRVKGFAHVYMGKTFRDSDIAILFGTRQDVSHDEEMAREIDFFTFKKKIWPCVHVLHTFLRREEFHSRLWTDGLLRICSHEDAAAILAKNSPGDFLMHFYPPGPSSSRPGGLGVTFVTRVTEQGTAVCRNIRIERSRLERRGWAAEIMGRAYLMNIALFSGNDGDPVKVYSKNYIAQLPRSIPKGFDMRSIRPDDDTIIIA